MAVLFCGMPRIAGWRRVMGASSPARSAMRRDAGPLSPAELIEFRRLVRHALAIEQQLDATAVAAMLGYKSKRTVLDLVRSGAFPGAWKPAHNVVRIPASSVHAFLEARRVLP